MKVSKLIAFVAMMMISISLFASTTTTSSKFTACKKAVELEKASWYEPSFVAKKPKVGKDEEFRAIEAPMCVYMHVVGGWKVVPLKTGTKLVFPKGENQPVRHAACNNDIRGAEYVGSVPTPALVETTVVKETVVVEIKVLCKQPDGTIVKPMTNVNGVATCPTVTVTSPVVTQSAPSPAPPQVQSPAQATCTDCRPEVTFHKKVARTDGRCVVAFKDPEGKVHFARFDTKRGTSLLVAARVDDVQAEWNHTYTPTYVGYIANGEKKTVQLDLPADCGAVYRAISHPAVLAWTGPRLGLTPDCVPVGRP